jgi:hypothetical protein
MDTAGGRVPRRNPRKARFFAEQKMRPKLLATADSFHSPEGGAAAHSHHAAPKESPFGALHGKWFTFFRVLPIMAMAKSIKPFGEYP